MYIMLMAQMPARLAFLAAALSLPGQVPPAERPNFSGTWKLNLARSGPTLPRGTEALTVVYEHRDPSLKYSEMRIVSGKTTHSDGKAGTIDGQLHTEHPAPGKTTRSIQKWEGSELVTHWELTDAEGITYVSDIRMSLSPDGKVLTMAEHYREPGMERIRDWVFDRQ
jgi:hypothetical protein